MFSRKLSGLFALVSYIAGLSALQLIRLVFHFSSPRPADSETLPRGADASARAAQTPAGGGGTLSRGDESAGKRAESSDRGDGALPQAAGTEPKRGESEPRSGDSEAKRGDTLPRSGESEGKRAVTFSLDARQRQWVTQDIPAAARKNPLAEPAGVLHEPHMRKIHRWLGVPAAIFLLLASFTGVWLECVRFFGAEETERERIRDLTSAVTAQSVGAEFGASFDKARAAAAALAGAQPLDKMVWQIKGDAPTITFFFGPQGPQAGRRIAVHARTGEVLSVEDYAEDSLILRLHSGEAFGDGGMVLGMVWGTLLFALTVTGIVIYFRMKPRTPRTGIRKVFWAFAGALLLTSGNSARADSPFFTDDPLFSPGWEIKLGATAEHNSGGDVWAGPILDLNYAVVPTVRLNLTLAYIGTDPKAGESADGFGTADFKVKWRFVEEDAKGWRPAVSIAPKVTLPTASTDHGLSDGVWRAQLPIEFGKTMGDWYHFTEAGYQWAFDRSTSDSAFWGVGTLYNFNKHFAAGAELYGIIPLEQQESHTFAATLGAVYTFNANWSLKASISHSLRDDSQPGPRPAGVFYVVWNF